MSFDLLKAFRRNAVHVRQALELLQGAAGPIGVDGGYLQDEGLIERYKRLSIPVRRALNPGDRASFAQALAALRQTPPAPAELSGIERDWNALQQELDTTVVLGGAKLPRRRIVGEWLDAVAFYDRLDHDRAYDRLVEQYGKAAEGISATITMDAARIIVRLDEIAAAAIGEPVILPPPPKTPAPPPDPKAPWWKRILG